LSNCFKPERNEAKLLPFSTYKARLFPGTQGDIAGGDFPVKDDAKLGQKASKIAVAVARNFT